MQDTLITHELPYLLTRELDSWELIQSHLINSYVQMTI